VRLWPTTVLTPDDWIAEVRFKDGSSRRIGVSPHLCEDQALAKVKEVLGWRKRLMAVLDISMKRRYQAFRSVAEMHPENQGRLIR
jgi:hypothetical protein